VPSPGPSFHTPDGSGLRFLATTMENKIAETPENAKRSTNKRNVRIQYRTSHRLTASAREPWLYTTQPLHPSRRIIYIRLRLGSASCDPTSTRDSGRATSLVPENLGTAPQAIPGVLLLY
jgi:hypothetical protein